MAMESTTLEMFDEVQGGYVEGEMNVPQPQNRSNIGQPDFNTLDEPIRDTVVSAAIQNIRI
ncbi:unnamed protein product [Callosobruchus maculatus]|uniref:Uncharacterized protein n=1 Tax=Callosobruchus maculatus TaxID=64391 RepID=A0A653CTN1_CALMS|nr:unnamed protein product [Callosobruchus maculatus]